MQLTKTIAATILATTTTATAASAGCWYADDQAAAGYHLLECEGESFQYVLLENGSQQHVAEDTEAAVFDEGPGLIIYFSNGGQRMVAFVDIRNPDAPNLLNVRPQAEVAGL